MYSSDKLTIDTPEQVALEFHLAGVGSRFLAIAFDTCLQIGGWIVLAIAVALIVSAGLPKIADLWLAAAIILLWFITFTGYYAIFEAIWNGQTPGKRLLRIRVVKDSGRPISPFDAILRNLVRAVDAFPVFYGVGIVTVMLSKENKRLGDYVAGTVVLHEKPLEEVQPGWEVVEAAVAAPPAPIYDGKRLTHQELQLIETFLQRRADLAPELRTTTAQQIASRVVQRLQITPDPSVSVEIFLETIARERRDAARFRG